MITTPARIEALEFRPGFARLPADFYEVRRPTPVPEPRLVAVSAEAAALAGLDASTLDDDARFLALASGASMPAGTTPVAAIYAGHQFGVWVPQLGDGRAITLGETTAVDGSPLEWQLKGAGMTAFSRAGDGRAVLRSTIREFLASEAMHALGIPTTRALAIVGSDEPVFRETIETAAVLTRLAPSHVRFGSFEVWHYRGRADHVKTLADYVIDRFMPELRADEAPYAAFLHEVVIRTARLMAQWQAVGFAHGVMNTDNMSILGLTLDYGPYGFLDAYDPGHICNHTDAGGRYAFDRQPTIALWNCYALAEALSTLVETDVARPLLEDFEPVFRQAYVGALRAKAGLARSDAGDAALIAELLHAMSADGVDWTIAWRALCEVGAQDDGSFPTWFRDRARIDAWLVRYRARLERESVPEASRRERMRAINPAIVLRNYLAEQAIAAAEGGDFAEVRRLQAALAHPYDDGPEQAPYAGPPPEWAQHISVSCSS